MNIQGVDCEGCGKEIGTESYVICLDGISNKQVTFHHTCVPQMSDVQRNHGVTLASGQLGMTGKDLT